MALKLDMRTSVTAAVREFLLLVSAVRLRGAGARAVSAQEEGRGVGCGGDAGCGGEGSQLRLGEEDLLQGLDRPGLHVVLGVRRREAHLAAVAQAGALGAALASQAREQQFAVAELVLILLEAAALEHLLHLGPVHLGRKLTSVFV